MSRKLPACVSALKQPSTSNWVPCTRMSTSISRGAFGGSEERAYGSRLPVSVPTSALCSPISTLSAASRTKSSRRKSAIRAAEGPSYRAGTASARVAACGGVWVWRGGAATRALCAGAAAARN
eukprot:5120230-Prymnesium_polylepis.1